MDTQPLRKEIQVFSELHVTLSKEVYLIYLDCQASLVAQIVKNLPATRETWV